MQQMQISLELGPSSLDAFNDTAQASAPFEHRLAAFGCRANGPPALINYFPLVDACCDALMPVLDELRARNYGSWLLMIGADMMPEQRSRYPAYALASPARKRGLLEGQKAEQDFQQGGKIRAAGLYQVSPERFAEECKFLTQNSWTLGVLSNRSDFLAVPGLAATYSAAGWNENGSLQLKTNFLELGALLGPMGDVIVKTDGAFDDKYRSVNLIYDSSTPVAAIFSAACERLASSRQVFINKPTNPNTSLPW